MDLLKLEHSTAAYRADFAIYGTAVLALAAFLVLDGPPAERASMLGLTVLGLLLWSPLEYGLHRYVLHGLQPFRRWHAEHHARPHALICSPTIFSASLILLLVFLPALALGNRWHASALTLGIVTGYLAYAVTHHAVHHWRAEGRWLRERKRWHALHHHAAGPAVCYGVTGGFWDRMLGSAPVAALSRRH